MKNIHWILLGVAAVVFYFVGYPYLLTWYQNSIAPTFNQNPQAVKVAADNSTSYGPTPIAGEVGGV